MQVGDDGPYRERLRNRIVEIAPYCSSFHELCSAAQGAFPADVVRELNHLKNEIREFDTIVRTAEFDEGNSRLFFPSIENLLTDFDWRFERSSAESLCSILREFSSVLCLGTPTIFALLSSKERDVFLVDQNYFYASELPGSADQIILASIEANEMRHVNRAFDAVILDPPWYSDDYRKWLSTAVSFAKDGAYIFLPIIPSLARPNADIEGREIYTCLETIGSTALLPFDVRYETPSFEVEVLKSVGLPALHGWRTVKFASVCVNNRQGATMMAASTKRRVDWLRYRFGTKTVATRAISIEHENIADGELFFLDSVSQRDRRIKYITALSSRNMATAINSVDLLKCKLEKIDTNSSEDPLVEALRLIECCHG